MQETRLIDGKALALTIQDTIAKDIANRRKQGLRPPCLAVILAGENPASSIYVRHKRDACTTTGIVSRAHQLPASVSENALISLIDELNNDQSVDGILIQLPLPDHIDTNKIIETVHPNKDVDGFHPYNLGRLAQRRPAFRPCTPYGIMHILEHIQQPCKKRHAVIVGASNIVGRPMALELLIAGATVTICHRFTDDLAKYVPDADILISAVGKPGLIQGKWIKIGATVIDVGITRLPNGTLVGDVDFATANGRAGWITPVPGGVGPMTVAMLLKNTLTANQLATN